MKLKRAPLRHDIPRGQGRRDQGRHSARRHRALSRRPVEDFTLEEVAERAGVAVRTILRAYPSKDELVYAALADMAAGGVFLNPSPPGDVKAAVTAFFDIYEGVGDLVMQWLNDERRHPGLKPTLDQGRDNHRDGVKTVFAPQLERLHGAARKELLTILIILTDVYVWKLLRRDMALSRAAAEATVRKMIPVCSKRRRPMARILWLNWSGGGNLPPSLGIARVLTERGHELAFAGRPEMVPRVRPRASAPSRSRKPTRKSTVTRKGCRSPAPPAISLRPRSRKKSRASSPPRRPTSSSSTRCSRPRSAHAGEFGRPSAVLVHTFVFRQLDMWRKVIGNFDSMRQQAGFPGLPPLDALWQPRERIISTSLAAFDAAPLAGWEMVRHAGPVLEDEKFAVPRPLPWPSVDPTPLVMVSFSTMFEQRNADKMQRTLDALADFQVHVVATTAGIVAPSELAVPNNAVVLDYAAHDPIMKRAALVVTHGGHGTAMRALRHGVPMILIPGLAGDQPSWPRRCRNSAPAWRSWRCRRRSDPRGSATDLVDAVIQAKRPRTREGARRRRWRGQCRRRGRELARRGAIARRH